MKRCIQCGRDLSLAEFRSSVGRMTVRCAACRESVNHYQASKRHQRIYAPDKPLRTIHCRVCANKTVARTDHAATLIGWRDVDMQTCTGVCDLHPVLEAA